MKDLPESILAEVERIRSAASELISRKWAESFFGNISTIMDHSTEHLEEGSSFPLEEEVSSIRKKILIVTGTGKTMRDVMEDPWEAIGVYRVHDTHIALLAGRGPPTSELTSHLMGYTLQRGSSIVHCHMDSVIEASMYPVELYNLPEGFCWVEETEPGSLALAEKTGNALSGNDTVVWRGHGAISMGPDPGSCIERLIDLDRFLGSHRPAST